MRARSTSSLTRRSPADNTSCCCHVVFILRLSPPLEVSFHKAAEAALHRLGQHRVLYLHSEEAKRLPSSMLFRALGPLWGSGMHSQGNTFYSNSMWAAGDCTVEQRRARLPAAAGGDNYCAHEARPGRRPRHAAACESTVCFGFDPAGQKIPSVLSLALALSSALFEAPAALLRVRPPW